jgi:Universal stress protein UspA and related nucleotide-binding proteins
VITILLATDGSPSAADATDEAIELALALEASVTVVAVEHVTVPGYGYYGYSDVYRELRNAEHVHVRRTLDETALRIEDAGVECETVAANGPVVDEICRIAREREAKLIVVGAHGWGAVRRFVFGSVSIGVLHEAPCPVVVVRSQRVADGGHVHADAAAV